MFLATVACDRYAYELSAPVALVVDTTDGGVIECPAPFAECDGSFQTSCETDLSLSADHCGKCGRSCEGGVCGQRVCGAVSLIQAPERSPSGLVPVTGGVAWLIDGGATLRRFDAETEIVSTLVAVSPAPSPTPVSKVVAALGDGTRIFWLNPEEGVLRATPVETPAIEQIATGVRAFARHGDELVWLAGDQLLARKIAGGEVRELQKDMTGVTQLAANAAGIFWVEPGGTLDLLLDPDGILITREFGVIANLRAANDESIVWAHGDRAGGGQCLFQNGGAPSCYDGFETVTNPRAFVRTKANIPAGNTEVVAVSSWDIVFYVTSADAASPTGAVASDTGTFAKWVVGWLDGEAASELAADAKHLYLSNIVTGLVKKVVL